MEIVLALICMSCKVADDFIHKLVAVEGEGKYIGFFYTLQLGIVTALLILSGIFGITHISFEAKNIYLGIAAGTLAFFTYYFFLKGLIAGEGSVSITIFRLNFIITGIIAFTLLGESVTLPKIMGVLLCLISIWLISGGKGGGGTPAKGIAFSILGCVFGGMTNAFSKFAINSGAQVYSLLTFRFITSLVMALIFFNLKEIIKDRGDIKTKNRQMAAAGISGVLMLFSVALLYIALGIGDVTTITPIIQLSFVFTSLVCIIYFREKLTPRKISALVIAVVCILIMSIK